MGKFRASLLATILIFVSPACAKLKRTVVEGKDHHRFSDASRDLYLAGEEMAAAGQVDTAVQLWRHALLQLPPDSSADELRHKLILRMAFVMGEAYRVSGNPHYLSNANLLLSRYLAKHQAIFGESEKELAQRKQIYEAMIRVEAIQSSQTQVVAKDRIVEKTSPQNGKQPLDEENLSSEQVEDSIEPPSKSGSKSRKTRREQDSNKLIADEGVRTVIVKPQAIPEFEKEGFQERFNGSFSNAFAGPVLTTPQVVMVNGPRPLVRIIRIPKSVEPTDSSDEKWARRAGYHLIRETREQLEQCYADSFSRTLEKVQDFHLSFAVGPSGQIARVRLHQGFTQDGLGNQCVLDALEKSQLEDWTEPSKEIRAEVRLRFFYQRPSFLFESEEQPWLGDMLGGGR